MKNDIIVEVQGGSEVGVHFMPLSDVRDYLVRVSAFESEVDEVLRNLELNSEVFFAFSLRPVIHPILFHLG